MKRYKRTSLMDLIEKIIIRLVIVTAVLLVVAQTFVLDDNPITAVMANVGSDKAGYNETAHWSEPRITFYLENFSSLPHLYVLVNGNKLASFTDRYLTIPVEHGDTIEIDGSFYTHSIQVKVLNVTEDILSPAVDHQLSIENNIVKVDGVRLNR
ncbi:hypothetical protein [Desulfofalx alkaliphila]|uniref:hypothetical protein n=1 Tax=Desulfofalx alkaliphila TaxID=105483 RepID=UPI0004E1C9FC|nr:hypothetical protein [Desulfofalx alkaliphila]